MRVCITEKPSVARDIAKILGAKNRKDGYFEGPDLCVTWTFGHLCRLKEPQEYSASWQRWSLASLPMIPPRFGITLINEKGIKKQFEIIKTLIASADEVINCGDAGQEGELIQRWVMQKAGIKCPVRRLWISSLTDEAIKDGFENLRPESEYKNLYEAGLCRAIGDWLLGYNATRLYTLKYGVRGTTLSVGRVQTPTLALIVDRHFQIVNFVPEDYWELKTKYKDVIFTAKVGKFKDKAKADAVLKTVAEEEIFITDIAEKKGTEGPPRLFDLTSLQVECNKQWGWTADQTLKNIQSLYEKKVTTYPRVDTTYLPDDVYNHIPVILGKMTPYANLTAKILSGCIPKSKRVFDSSKVTDHHAIIPTGESPTVLIGDERKLYHLIALRFIANFYPDCKFNTTTVTAKAGSVDFKVNGKVITEQGWREILTSTVHNDSDQSSESEKEELSSALLPSFKIGERGTHEPFLSKKTTQPPKAYTEGTLLRAMESAGKNVDDETLREALKENGIGRPSTRSAIIEKLFSRGYLHRERKNIHPTQAGIDLIGTIRTDLLKSAALTGLWENKLRRIERGNFTAKEFIDEIKILLSQVIETVLSDNGSTRIQADTGPKNSGKDKKEKKKTTKPRTNAKKNTSSSRNIVPKSISEIMCPECKKGHLLRGRTAFGCSQFREGCSFRINFDSFGPDPEKISVKNLLDHIKTLKTTNQ